MNKILSDINLIGDNIPWLKSTRLSGVEAFKKQGVPTPKTEAWKYTKPSRFFVDDLLFNPKGGGESSFANIEVPFESYQIHFENGIFRYCSSELPKGLQIVPMIEEIILNPEIRTNISKLVDINTQPFVALNNAYLNEGICIKIDEGVCIDKPILLIHHVGDDNDKTMYNLRNLIIANKNSSSVFMEYYCYDGNPKKSYFVNVVNEIYVDSDAVLKHYKVQNEAYKAAHIAMNAVRVDAKGSYNSFCMQKGADLSRNESKVVLIDEMASTCVDAAYIMEGWATIDTTTNIEHLKPNTHSSQLIKGVVGGQAKGVFQGKIHIAPDAVKTEGYQLHKAMLLSDEAEVDVKPELEIFADDVKCSHGAACGQLDADQLFYMQSRGISKDDAKQLLIEAYLEDVIAKVDDEKICNWIKSIAGTNKSISL